jgi:ectoine hydroxylase
MTEMVLTDEQIASYHADGYVILPDFFSPELMELLLRIARSDQRMLAGAADRLDTQGRVSRLSLRYDLPEDMYSAFVRSQRLVGAMEQLLRTEVYHYHHKMMLKEPRVGGAWEWHQDYGYWYQNFLRSAMASCMIAVDRAHRGNGCLQVLQGSQRYGRIEHGKAGDQVGAASDRVEAIEKHCPKVYCEVEPGSVLFFHSNLLHRSDPNLSPDPRWSLICCYSAADNTPFRSEVQGQYAHLERWDDRRLEQVGQAHWEKLQADPG